jgi:hypothetical protein
MEKKPSYQSSEKKCVENDGPVGAILAAIVKEDCEKLKVLIGSLTEVERTRRGLRRINESKKCCLVETEHNYQLYRNLELGVGVELVQACTEIKNDVAGYIVLNTGLAETLKKLVTKLKEAKEKFRELKKAADDLDTCSKDKCSCTQMAILVGEEYKSDKRDTVRKEPACETAAETIRRLVDNPETYLHDIGIALNAAADVAGIQTFMNIESLKPFQESFTASATAFESYIKERMTKGAEDLKTCQTELEASTVELVKADYILYRKRNEADGEKETIEYLCCHKCGCVDDSQGENGKNRLKDCKEKICEICDKAEGIYCDYPGNDHNEHDPEQSY